MDPVEINFQAMFSDLEHHEICYVLNVCGLRDIPSQTRLIEYKGIETVEDLANYIDTELNVMADRQAFP
jgi:hypothetical protein